MAGTTQPRAIPPLLKHLNERTVLETIRARAPISRAEISRLAGISKPTVSLALQSLLEAQLVREARPDPGRPSYGAVFFEAVPDAAFVLGLDLGERFLRGAVCDLGGGIRARQDVEISGVDAEGALKAMIGLYDALLAASGAPRESIDGAVVGVPCVVEADTGTLRLARLAGLEGRAFALDLRERLGLDTTVENDINLAALGERWLGVARGVDDFAFLSVGTGMGMGLVLDGRLHRGHNGAAGEVDWALAGVGPRETVDPSAESLPALISHIAEDGAWEGSLASLVDARAVFSAARSGDRLARAVVDEIARRTAAHIAPIAAVADVALVVLGGGIGTSGDLLLDRVRALLSEWMPYPPRVETSSLGEAAVLTGALAVGVDSALDNVFTNRAATLRVRPQV
jgi:predicted NBD/HSP70 family sugar kinase